MRLAASVKRAPKSPCLRKAPDPQMARGSRFSEVKARLARGGGGAGQFSFRRGGSLARVARTFPPKRAVLWTKPLTRRRSPGVPGKGASLRPSCLARGLRSPRAVSRLAPPFFCALSLRAWLRRLRLRKRRLASLWRGSLPPPFVPTTTEAVVVGAGGGVARPLAFEGESK